MQLELRHLRSFIVVADELNFSRAAGRLHIAQPALSAQIRQLERQLGCRLFARTTRRVALTPAGTMLLADAREIVARADAAVAKVRAAARGERGLVRVGFVAHGAAELGGEILRRFAEAYPAVETSLAEAATLEELQHDLLDRESDVAFAWLPLVHGELVAEELRSEALLVGLSHEHPLASRAAVTVADLRAVPIVAPWEDVPFELLRPWLGEARPAGRRPEDPNGTELGECLAIAGRGQAVYCVPESVSRFYSRPGLVFRPVSDATPSRIAVAWRRDTPNAAVASFVETALAVASAIQNDSF